MKTLMQFIDKYGYGLTVGELLAFSQGFSGPPSKMTTACMDLFEKWNKSKYVQQFGSRPMHIYANGGQDAILYLGKEGLLDIDKVKKVKYT